MEELQAKLVAAEQEAEKLRGEFKSLEDQMFALMQKSEEAVLALEAAQGELAALRQANKEQSESHAEELFRLRSELATAKEDLALAYRDIGTLEVKLTKLTRQQPELAAQYAMPETIRLAEQARYQDKYPDGPCDEFAAELARNDHWQESGDMRAHLGQVRCEQGVWDAGVTHFLGAVQCYVNCGCKAKAEATLNLANAAMTKAIQHGGSHLPTIAKQRQEAINRMGVPEPLAATS